MSLTQPELTEASKDVPFKLVIVQMVALSAHGFARITDKPQCVVSVHSPLTRGELNLLLTDPR